MDTYIYTTSFLNIYTYACTYIYIQYSHTHIIYIHMHSDIVGLLQLRMWIEGLGFRV